MTIGCMILHHVSLLLRRTLLLRMFVAFYRLCILRCFFFFFQAEDGIRDLIVTGVQTCALPISGRRSRPLPVRGRLLRPVVPLSPRRWPPRRWLPEGRRCGLSVAQQHVPGDDGREIGRASCRERV